MTDAIRLGTGQLSFKDESVDLDKFLSNTIKDLQKTFPSHKIRIIGKSKQIINIDPYRLNQVITNLVSNAVKYSPDSNIVIIEVENISKYVKIKIIDSGVGISKSDRYRLFRPFSRIESSSTKFPGLGLGLYLTKSILSRYSGKISHRSRPNSGSIFTIKLPVA